jgi:hypothetical protein
LILFFFFFISILNHSRIEEEEKGRQEAGEDAGLKVTTFSGT